MTINLRDHAPSQVTQTDPEKLSEEIQKLLDIQTKIKHHEDLIEDLKQDEKYFSEMLSLKKQLNVNELSMGMSNDYILAVKHGTTFVRIGSKIFGLRG